MSKPETFHWQLSRVKRMANDDVRLEWELSDEDTAALRAVLASREALLKALISITGAYSALLLEHGDLPNELCRQADDAITGART